MFDYAARQARLEERLDAEGIAALFLSPSADLEYLTGVERQLPFFGEVNYAHGWVTGALFRPHRDPVFLFPRMFAAFDLREQPDGEVIVVNETDDGSAIFECVAAGVGGSGAVATGDRVWAAVNAIYAGFLAGDRGAIDRNIAPDATLWDSAHEPLIRGKAELEAVRDGRPKDGSAPVSLDARDPVIDVLGDVALVRHLLTVDYPDGTQRRVRNTSVWLRGDGRWLCVHNHEDLR